METELTKLKCRDCMHCHNAGWWEELACDISGFPVDPDGPACISALPKKPVKPGNCLTK